MTLLNQKNRSKDDVMKFTPILFVIALLCLSGCGESDIKGNAFVIKGNGDIKPAAGSTVYLVPESSVNSLLTRAISDVTPKVMKSYKKIIGLMCPPAKNKIVGLDAAIKTKIQGIKDNGNTLASGCLPLQDKVLKLDSAFQSVKSEHLKKLSAIESQLKKMKSKRSLKVTSSAAALKKKSLKSLTARISRQHPNEKFLASYYEIFVMNNTDYYIDDLHIDVFSKGVKIANASCYGRKRNDNYGFYMASYLAAPHSKAKKGSCTYKAEDISDDPKSKLLVSQKKLPLNKQFYQQHIIPSKVVITGATFKYKPIKKTIEKAIKYTSKDVSFHDVASQKKYPEDATIAKLETSITIEKSRYKANKAYEEYTLTKAKADLCNTDQAALEKANNNLSDLGQIKVEIDNCLKGEFDTQSLYQSLVTLGEITNMPKLPDVTALINDAAIKQVAGIITGKNSKKADATINGLFKFNKVSNGKYILYSHYKDSFVDGFWLTPITVKEDGQFDLNNNTLIKDTLDYYLAKNIANISN